MIVIVEVLIALFAVVYCWFKWSYETFKRRGIPYAEPTFPVGSTTNTITTKENVEIVISKFYNQFKKQGHTIGAIFLFRQPTLIACHPETIRSILSKDFQYFTDRPHHVNEEVDPLSGNLLRLKGMKWKNMRAKLTPTFTSGKMKMMYPLLVECCEHFLGALHDVSLTKEPVDIKEVLARFNTDVIGTCAFGLECKSLENDNSEFRRIGKIIFEPSLFRILKQQFIRAFPKLGSFFRLKQFGDEVEHFFLKIVTDAIRYRKSNNVVRNDFLKLLMDIQDKGDLTIEEVCAQCFVFFGGGFETSSTLVSFCLYELAKNQDIQQKVREEVQHAIEKNGGNLCYDALQEMKYLGCVLDETLRKYPPAMALTRLCVKKWTEPKSGIIIEAGETVAIPVVGLQNDPEYFPDPLKFNPDRFNDENKKKIIPYTYLPFGEGPRICIALRFGLMQSRVGVAMLLDKFKFTLNKGTKEPIIPDPHSTLYAAKDPIFLDIEELVDRSNPV